MSWKIVNASTPAEQMTVVVLGCFRGGTSMVTAVIKEFGICMGTMDSVKQADKPYPDHEDATAQELLHDAVFNTLAKDRTPVSLPETIVNEFEKMVIKPRTENLKVWGWKYPGTVFWLNATDLGDRLTNPHFVVVQRDSEAVWDSEVKNSNGWLKEGFREQGPTGEPGRCFRYVSRQNDDLAKFERLCERPLFSMDFEQTRTANTEEKGRFVDALSLFLGCKMSAVVKESALGAIRSPEPTPKSEAPNA